MGELVAEGKVTHLGVSETTATELAQAVAMHRSPPFSSSGR